MSTTTTTVSIPQAPQDFLDVGIPRNLVEDLAVKTLFMAGELTVSEMGRRLKLSMEIAEDIFNSLRKQQLCEVKGMVGGVHRITTTDQGKSRALELMRLNQYVGPAPISLGDYTKWVNVQSVKNVAVSPVSVRESFNHLILGDEVLDSLGTAIVSGGSLFLYGPAGTGKTSIAEALPNIYGDHVWIPYAVEVDGQIITVYDSVIHVPIDDDPPEDSDTRYVLCRRPRVITGGELTIDMLDLQFNPVSKFYAAPMQMKANCGVLIIDDFGRQRMQPEDMLNRWIVPLDRRIDYLTLMGGKKFEIPFELLIVFATNLDPAELADDAFLRRIQNKIKVDHVTPDQFHGIFQLVCNNLKLDYDHGVVDHLISVLLNELHQPLRPCYPRDILSQIVWAARYNGKEAHVDSDTIAQAIRNYFLPTQ